MHDYDRTTLEHNNYELDEVFEMDEMDEFDGEMAEYDDDEEYEYDDEIDEYDYEMDEYDGEMEEYDYEMDEFDGEMSFEADYPFSEEEEAELAYELLAVTNQQEMDEFLGKWIKKAARGIKRFVRKPFKYIKRGLRKVARVALPLAGRAAGTFFGGPIGSKIGGTLGRYASRLFEVELEGLSPEDQEFEIAKRYIRFGTMAARNSAKISKKLPPAKATKIGFKKAAKKHAPGLLKMKKAGSRKPSLSRTFSKSGRWYRKGKRIILQGV